jgi:antitoxin ParD1/3/4
MTTMTISIPETTRKFVEAQAKQEGFASVDEYLVSVLRQVQLREAKRKLEAKLIEGLESGPAVPVTPEFWTELEREVFEQLETERRGR